LSHFSFLSPQPLPSSPSTSTTSSPPPPPPPPSYPPPLSPESPLLHPPMSASFPSMQPEAEMSIPFTSSIDFQTRPLSHMTPRSLSPAVDVCLICSPLLTFARRLLILYQSCSTYKITPRLALSR